MKHSRLTGMGMIRVIAIFLLGVAAHTAHAQDSDTGDRPNVLIILVDDMGYGDLSCFGSKQIQTPHIDALAASGIRCTQGYVSSSVCSPSRSGLMTGRYQNRFGAEHNLSYPRFLDPKEVGVPKSETMLSQYLQDGGYQTACIGKWHLGEHAEWHLPNARGFDYFFGMRKGNHNYFPKAKNNQLHRNDEPVTKIDVPYLTDWFTQETIDYIERTEKDEPWFMYLSYNTPHTPLQAKEEDIARFSNIPDKKRRVYCAMQHCLDENIGKLMAYLDESKQRENTLVIFFSDNGGPCVSNASINAPLRGQKGSFLEGGVRVPYIFSWPSKLPSGIDYHQPFSALDLLPTILAIADVQRPAAHDKSRPLDGVDLMPFLQGERRGERPHDVFCWRICQRSAGIRMGDWKLVRVPDRMPQLYDLRTDISEQRDLASRHSQQANQMLKALFDWEASFKQVPIWESNNSWMRRHRELYDTDYILEQPAP